MNDNTTPTYGWATPSVPAHGGNAGCTYRVLGCVVYDGGQNVNSDVPDEEAEFWTVYERHGDDGTSEANLEFAILDDFDNRADAEAALNVPAEGTKVRVLTDYETREPGDDEQHPLLVKAGAIGTIRGYVLEWYDVHVELDEPAVILPTSPAGETDGRHVWISPNNLTPVQ